MTTIEQSPLADLDAAVHLLRGGILTTERPADDSEVVASVGPLPASRLGSAAFRERHGVRYAYQSGAMAGGIASADLVVAMARAGFLASFGAAGLTPDVIEQALLRFAREIPGLPFACNLISSPSEPALEQGAVEMFLRHEVRCVEASAFVMLSPNIVRYRVAGLSRGPDGEVMAANRVIAKVSRPEVAARFLAPPPESIVAELVRAGLVTAEQAELAQFVPVADDITAEADSGGHTDRRPLPVLLPIIIRQRDAAAGQYEIRVGVGAAGGIGTPESVAGAFAMGADYVVTGSINQACVEAGTSPAVRLALAAAGLADFQMAPAADMFELGAEIQVLRRNTMFPMRAKRLYELYRRYDGVEAIPDDERIKLEGEIFRQPLENVWREVTEYFSRRDPSQLERAAKDPKRRMALLFRWYLGMASRWASTGDENRRLDYQVWCGPAVAGFNEWAGSTFLKDPGRRKVAEVALHLMKGAAFNVRATQLRLAGGSIRDEFEWTYCPTDSDRQ
ncbi:PfaD family polyunsaturated fatty acid/polyketide biosynthesis protein [Lentzea sp. BCCO 10_0798]|uniref:PfaD family polyunsaturated fatty acid/polyketide biosynthesis protein n=1 Tax=Lentzea kristufekii TaxID=3095430 RepID=A0ABU4U0C8_9PSEU|nr:PfaD family polyunsaturated fatty acid/polyketide biosynthesis protein [Lentzea sp. BCCO 10_0798]MDX8053729.1 PfaD family polyunsaturated fatty acid/polyketide biosynthesis protein [Lentzea sp. BCCO 10_0798]